MLEEFRAKRAVRNYEILLERWDRERSAQEIRLRQVREFRGAASADILLDRGEALFFKLTGAGLVEGRRGPGHYRGGSSGMSVGVGPVRTRVGSSRGTYVQGQVRPTIIDQGTVYVTNHRVIFRGLRQTRECVFSRLIGASYGAGWAILSMANRQQPVELRTGKAAENFAFRLELALAHYRGTLPQLASWHSAQLAQIQARKPAAPGDHRVGPSHSGLQPAALAGQPSRSAIQQLSGDDGPAGPLTPERLRAMHAYEEYCIAQVAWADADPATRGPEPQWADYQPRSEAD